MKIYLYKMTNEETGEIVNGLRGADVKKILQWKGQVSALADRKNPVVKGWKVEKTGESEMEELNPFTKETYFEWVYWCNVILGKWKRVKECE